MKTLSTFFLLLSVCLLFVKSAHAQSSLIINEFAPAESTEWVEILNKDSANSIDLTNYKISNGSTVLQNLSGSIPKTGLLTFELPAGSITDAGDCLVLLDGYNTAQYSISFGTGSCGVGSHLAGVPSAGQTAGLTNGTTWAVIGTPTRGWCNDSFGGCPTISTIVSAINASRITTNLGGQSDYSRITGLYFERTGYGRIEFQNTMNLTDSDSLTWLASLDSKLDLSTIGTISLDADLIKNLVNTQATLTMEGLTFNDPEVWVNGAPDTGGVVSALSYDGTQGRLMFLAAHFTTFTAREQTGTRTSSSSGHVHYSSTGTPYCSDSAPASSPDLFQIDVTGSSAKLFFTPIANTNTFFFSYSTQSHAEEYGAQVSLAREGVQNFTVELLKPNTTYYFKVRGQNGCMPGGWSRTMQVRTKGNGVMASYPVYASMMK